MIRRRFAASVMSMLPSLALGACLDQHAPTESNLRDRAISLDLSPNGDRRHVVVFDSENVSPGFTNRVAALNGHIVTSLDAIGVVVVGGLTDAAAARLAAERGIAGVERGVAVAVSHDYGDVGLAEPDRAAEATESSGNAILTPMSDSGGTFSGASGTMIGGSPATSSPATAPLFPRQWNMHAVSAPEAWGAGHLGSRDVVVAILDTGIDYLHPDLIGLVDIERSISLVPEDDPVIASQYPGRRSISDLHGHGTVAASIVGSNATMVAGINRHVTLLAVKIWDRAATGPIDRMIRGIVYAADHGADVVTISGSYVVDRSEHHGVITAVQRAVNHAVSNGAVVISIAGNDAADLDRAGSFVRMPCEAANVICASATAPASATSITGPWENMDAPAPYAAFGRSAIDVAAPGGLGDFANPNPSIGQFRRIWAPCTTTPTPTSLPACARGMPLAQSFGTSWAAPHVAGLAALLVAQRGHGRPADIRARILGSADDLGEPGTDPRYGRGRIDVARALGVMPP